MAARGDGRDVLLHEPQTETDANYFAFRHSATSTAASPILEVFVPELALRVPEGGTLTPQDLRFGAWTGVTRTLKATKVHHPGRQPPCTCVAPPWLHPERH